MKPWRASQLHHAVGSISRARESGPQVSSTEVIYNMTVLLKVLSSSTKRPRQDRGSPFGK